MVFFVYGFGKTGCQRLIIKLLVESHILATMRHCDLELMILLSAFAAVFGMFGLNKLPQYYQSI